MTPPFDLEGSPLWQQGHDLEEGCATFLRGARPYISLSDWERLANRTWLFRQQVALAVQPGSEAATTDRLETARSTIREIHLQLAAFTQHAKLAPFSPQLTHLATLAESCHQQLHAWIQRLHLESDTETAASPAPSPSPAATRREADWNNAFALLVQLQHPPSPRRKSS